VVINSQNRHRFEFGVDKDCDGDGVVDNRFGMDKEPNIEEPNIDSSGVCSTREKEKESSWDKEKESGGPSSGINFENDGIDERIDDEELVGERDDIESEEDSAFDTDLNDSEEDIGLEDNFGEDVQNGESVKRGEPGESAEVVRGESVEHVQ